MSAYPLKILPGYKPLLYWKGQLLLARGRDLVIANLDLDQLRYINRLPAGTIKNLFPRMRLVTRLLRLEVGPACDPGDGMHCLVFHHGRVFKLNMQYGTLIRESTLPRVHRPLQFTRVDVDGFLPGIYFGEYFQKPEKKEVRIFRRNKSGHWAVAYTFANGEINHVHNIVQDYERKCLYVLTGDFGAAAAIWEARENFSHMVPLGVTGQNKRACWMKVTKNRLVYASDTDMEPNHLYSIDMTERGCSSPQSLQPITGSSIYCAHSASDRLIFSTAVEPSSVRGNKYLAWFSRRRGPGILSDNACLYAGRINGEIQPIFHATKDILPFGLFQFGSLQFPSGFCEDENHVHIYGVAVKGIDGCTVLLKLPQSQII